MKRMLCIFVTVILVSGCSKRTVHNGLTVYNDGCLTGEFTCFSVREPTTYREFIRMGNSSFSYNS